MTYLLLFDSHCASCSRVARLVRDLEIAQLDTASLHQPDVQHLFESAGLPVPGKPALINTAGHHLQVWTGLAMRVRLTRVIGVRRASSILRLVAAEAAARSERAGSTRQLGRRGVLGAAAAGIGAVVLGPAAAAGAKPDGDVSLGEMTAAVRQRVLASKPAREAVAAWGPIDTASVNLVTGGDGTKVAALPHTEGSAVTYVEAAATDPVAAVTIVTDSAAGSLRYHTTTGVPVVEQKAGPDGKVQTKQLAQPDGTAQPDSAATFAVCMYVCLDAKIDQNCVNTCASCGQGGWGAIVNCPLCGACAGVNGVKCAYDCRAYY